MAVTGRRPSCNSDTAKLLAGAIRRGLTNKDACLAVGVSESAYYEWLDRGRTELERVSTGNRRIRPNEAAYVEFVQEIEKAIPHRKLMLLDRIQSFTDRDWRAAAWLLERLHPDEFGQREKLEILDWREELRRRGYDPEQTVAAIKASLRGSTGEPIGPDLDRHDDADQ